MLTNRSMAPGTIFPELPYDDVTVAVTWLCKTFGFKEHLRIGNHRAQLVYGSASIIVIERDPKVNAGSSVMVRVEDVNAHHEHAAACGARIIRPPQDYLYGERQYTVEDLGGHRWKFSQSIADVDPKQWGGVLFE